MTSKRIDWRRGPAASAALAVLLFLMLWIAAAPACYGAAVESAGSGKAASLPIQLAAGDINGDGRITLEDRSLLLEARYFGKEVAAFSGMGNDETGVSYLEQAQARDLDEDGWITFRDLQVLMRCIGYGRGMQVVTYE